MPSVAEKYNSRRQVRGKSPTMEIGYIILDADNEDQAQDAMRAYAPTTWTVDGTELPTYNPEVSALADTIWEGKMIYGYGSIEQTIAFDTGGGRAKVTHSKQTQSYPAAGVDVAPDFQGAIGVTKSGIEGAEVIEPALSFTIKKTFPPELVTIGYVSTLSGLTGNYNNASWNGFAAGEIRFEGASGDQKQLGDYVDIAFKFTRSVNVTGATLGGIEGINKLGWQYIWFLYEEEEDTDAHFLVRRAIAAYVEDLPNCGPVDFSLIGIGD